MRKKFISYAVPCIGDDDIKESDKVLRSDWIATGPKQEEFSNAISKYTNANHSIAVSSCTAALDIAIGAMNFAPESEIITTPFTFAATSNAILYNRCKPVFADIDKETRNIDPKSIEKRITKKTKAVIYVDYAGHPCEMDEIKEIAKKHGLYTIEDAAHSIGAEYRGRKIGSIADVTAFSFHALKNITTGEGGAVSTNDQNLYEKMKMLMNHGIDKSAMDRFGKEADYGYDMKMLGKNYRMTDFQCAIGISQLRKLDSFIKIKSKLSEFYDEELSKIVGIEIPEVKPHVKHAWHLYTVLLGGGIDRDAFFRKMRTMNIGVNVHYIPIYNFTYYKQFNINKNDFPITEDVYRRIITLPLHAKMTKEDAKDVIEAVRTSLN